eukprot:Partr_v1_DN24243_c0_g1_i5_m36620 putative Slowmo homolog
MTNQMAIADWSASILLDRRIFFSSILYRKKNRNSSSGKFPHSCYLLSLTIIVKMKLFSTTHRFDHSWQSVSSANWRKYPSEMSPHVQSVDILDRQVDPKTGIMRTERLLACKQPIPQWMRRLMGADEVSYFREVSYVDSKSNTLTAVTRNLTYSHMMTLEEVLVYSPDPANPANATRMWQGVEVDATGIYSAFKTSVEEMCVNRFQANAEKGRKGLELAIRNLLMEDGLMTATG